MEKGLILLILGLFLLLSWAESRPIIQTAKTSPKDHQSNQLLSGFSSPLVLEETNYLDDIDGCKGVESEEKCLIRRSMAAHIDYIYTQDIDGHPCICCSFETALCCRVSRRRHQTCQLWKTTCVFRKKKVPSFLG